MDGRAGNDQPGKRRFQFGLRSLFLMNVLVAMVLGVPKYFAQEPGAILAVLVLVLGATWTLLMAHRNGSRSWSGRFSIMFAASTTSRTIAAGRSSPASPTGVSAHFESD